MTNSNSVTGLEAEFSQKLAVERRDSIRALAISENDAWKDTITNVIRSVVSIKLNQCVDFDSERPYTGEATGFIVDAERGIIITNRHVVGTGPFSGYAVFDNHEEADVIPIFRDPIHDYGFLKFNPKDIKYMKITQLEIDPQLAQVGTEIRVVGNDNGEKLSIMSGIISRIDRAPPDYGTDTYNDFNTEYIQASASLTGGSSGSPVVNSEGIVVAMQAGGSFWASTDYFLPLFRAKRALKCLQNNETITRGDIQVVWTKRPYGECERLGLSSEVERSVRSAFPESNGLLCAKLVIPKGTCDGLIKEGDILVSVNDDFVVSLVKLDEILDDNVGREVKFTLRRGNGNSFDLSIKIGNLFDITPSKYVHVFGSIVYDISYQICANNNMPITGVVVTRLIDKYATTVIESINDKVIHNLDNFIEVIKDIPNGARVPIAYYQLGEDWSEIDKEQKQTKWQKIDRKWFSRFVMATCNDITGLWDIVDLAEGFDFPKLSPTEPEKATYKKMQKIDNSEDKEIDLKYDTYNRILRSIVEVEVNYFYEDDGTFISRLFGTGIILDVENGYVLVQQNDVSGDMCDVQIEFGNAVEVSGKVVFMHPHQNITILKYDPQSLIADIQPHVFSETPLKRGEKCLLIGSSSKSSFMMKEVTIAGFSTNHSEDFGSNYFFNSHNLELESAPGDATGILCDNDGTFRGVYFPSLYRNVGNSGSVLDINDLQYIAKGFKTHTMPTNLRIVDSKFEPRGLLEAKKQGVPSEWVAKYNDHDASGDAAFLQVTEVHAPIISNNVDNLKSTLEVGDVILTIDGKLATSLKDVNALSEKLSFNYKVLRRTEILDLTVPTVMASDMFSSHLLAWCGLFFQAPSQGTRNDKFSLPSGVHIVGGSAGYPVLSAELQYNSYVTEVNDQSVKTMDEFVDLIKAIPHNTYVKIRYVHESIPVTKVVKTDYHYFPTGEFKKDKDGNWVELSPLVVY